MVLENENDHIAQLIDDQFYLGSNLLIAPILTSNTTQRQVYLPRGEWFLLGQKNKSFRGMLLSVCMCDWWNINFCQSKHCYSFNSK
ncbi:hypothetical protein [Spiroplasma endosymbiont of Ammophila pubescens]|uniref:hypothetical protein n=1 Tax=Spiroplasma endosymbiont of Ammophila pubescens TaxID=3066315 RepID=UPI0032B1ABEE